MRRQSGQQSVWLGVAMFVIVIGYLLWAVFIK